MPRLQTRALQALTRLSLGAPKRVVVGALGLAVLALATTVFFLDMKTDRNDLVPPSIDWNQRYLQYVEEFGGKDEVLIVFEGGPLTQQKAFADQVAQQLMRADWAQKVLHRVDPQTFEKWALLYLDEDTRASLLETLQARGPSLLGHLMHPGLMPLLKALDTQLAAAHHPLRPQQGSAPAKAARQNPHSNASTEPQPARLHAASEPKPRTPAHNETDAPSRTAPTARGQDLTFLVQVLKDVRARLTNTPPPPYSSVFGAWFQDPKHDSDGYLLSESGRFLFVLMTPTEGDGFDLAGQAIDQLKSLLEATAPDFPGVRYGITGQPVIASEEMRASTEDTVRATWVALIGVSLLFIFGFKRIRNPLFAVASLIIGFGWSLGATTLLVGHLTVLSVAFASILIGLGVDFGIHLIARYEDARAEGKDIDQALQTAVLSTGPASMAAGLTTALAFYVLTLTDFRGIGELGIIAGTGVLLCLVASLTVTPAFIKLLSKKAPQDPARPGTQNLPGTKRAAPAIWLGAGLGITLWAATLAPHVKFDGNLLNLQAEGTDAVDWELAILKDGGHSSAFAASIADTLRTTRDRVKRFKSLPEVQKVESIADLIPEDQSITISKLQKALQNFSALPQKTEPPKRLPIEAFYKQVRSTRRRLDALQSAAPKEHQAGSAHLPLHTLLTAIEAALETALEPGQEQRKQRAENALHAYQMALYHDVLGKMRLLHASQKLKPIAPDDLPRSVRDRLQSKNGRFLIRVYPRHNIWEDEAQRRFVEALRTVDPHVTDTPVQVYESRRLMTDGYAKGGLYALGVVLLLLLLDLRSLRDALFAAIPLIVGGLWTLGFMHLVDLRFNLANLIILPLLIGIGIDTGLHMVHRFKQEGLTGLALIRHSTGRAVILSGLTTAIGFGALGLARHRGIQSLGILLGVGVLLTLLAALSVLATSLTIFARQRNP